MLNGFSPTLFDHRQTDNFREKIFGEINLYILIIRIVAGEGLNKIVDLVIDPGRSFVFDTYEIQGIGMLPLLDNAEDVSIALDLGVHHVIGFDVACERHLDG